ncbi:UDP-N-acetylglucosamine 2-epimerase [Fervidicella metallireducens AeB]|uniref:UDP-N-acetylglucosamine 2-epimerase n=1 Tax=Fervidicella metallireducens AeB TaxID=1403537 RepID=A0A017RWJ7_9CLOT|nr:UDP-N-acetylglucosamine 2-epimerase [Fervidicella metallireducens]EYE88784.1 UDP-N-acetylglucosamine 2-epimerase [Fervidicella metallireducens AeB]
MKRIGVVTTSRADFGLLFPIINRLEKSKQFKVKVIATGIHLLKEHGNTIKYVKEKCQHVDEVDLFMSDINKYTLVKSLGIGFLSFADYLKNNKFDLVIVLGDRTELIVPVYSSMLCDIPVCHIFGGDTIDEYVTYDNNVRHCITKLASIHFTALEDHAIRIKKMGEEEWRVFNVGSPAIDYINMCKFLSRDDLGRKFNNLDFKKPFCVLTFHPVPTEFENIELQINNIIKALSHFDIQVICTKPNNDLGSDKIMNIIKNECYSNPRFLLVDSLSQEEYYSLLKNCSFVIGNSSSGILESASFKIPAINIGTRQKGRVKGDNVLDCGIAENVIVNSILKATQDKEFKEICNSCENPYGDGNTSKKIENILTTLLMDKKKLLMKKITY